MIMNDAQKELVADLKKGIDGALKGLTPEQAKRKQVAVSAAQIKSLLELVETPEKPLAK